MNRYDFNTENDSTKVLIRHSALPYELLDEKGAGEKFVSGRSKDDAYENALFQSSVSFPIVKSSSVLRAIVSDKERFLNQVSFKGQSREERYLLVYWQSNQSEMSSLSDVVEIEVESIEKNSRNTIRGIINNISAFNEIYSNYLLQELDGSIVERLQYLYSVIGEGDNEQEELSIDSLKFFLDFLVRFNLMNYPSLSVSPDGEILAEWRTALADKVLILFRKEGMHHVLYSGNRQRGSSTIAHSILGTKESILSLTHFLEES